MAAIIWIAGGLVALVLCLYLLQTFIGMAITLRAAGRVFLSAELKRAGIRQLVPDSCVFEIADNVTDTYAGLAERLGWSAMTTKTEILKPLERDARVVREWLRGRDIAGDAIKYIPDSLKKNGVVLGALLPEKDRPT
jgi:hypothetical protein